MIALKDRIDMDGILNHPWMKGPTPSMKDLAEEFTIRKKAADAKLEEERQEKKASTTTSINPSGKSHRSAETLSVFKSPGE